MAVIGEVLRTVRIQWGLSLRDVKKRSLGLADEWGSRSYEVSGSWLCKAERGNPDITIPKLISLATIYSRPPEELLRHCLPAPPRSLPKRQFLGPNTTVLISGGGLVDQEERHLLPAGFTSNPVPEETTLLRLTSDAATTSIRKAVIGMRDRALYPMIRPGSVLEIDIRRKSIAPPQAWKNEFDRPIYLLQTHEGLVSGWCDLDEEGQWLTVVSHTLSRVHSRRWRYRKDIEVIGRAVAAAIRFTPFEDESSTQT